MQITKLSIPEVVLFEPKVFGDDRGFFFESYNGRVFEDVMRRAKLTHHELTAALRRAGCSTPEEVQAAILENNGSISVVMRSGQWVPSGRDRDVPAP